MDEMLEGFTDLYPEYVQRVQGGVIRSNPGKPGKVAVIVGGGSGHYPAFCGVVGEGFADGAVVGNIFTSPSTQDAVNVGLAAHNGAGILFITGNYAGDVINFDLARDQLRSDGLAVNNFYVTDDVASAPIHEITKRRGIAGDFTVFKIASAAAEQGLDLTQVTALATRANENTRTLGVAFAGCTLPGAKEPLFNLPLGKMGVGLGIHGESGISEDELPSADEVASILVEGALRELSNSKIKKIAVLLNGLGSTKYEELFVTWRTVSRLLKEKGYEVIQPEVDEIVTSLDMAGCSLTITLLDEELERLWRAPANTPAYKKGETTKLEVGSQRKVTGTQNQTKSVEYSASSKSQAIAGFLGTVFEDLQRVIAEAENDLGKLDSVAGDGDHGRGMLKGISAASKSATHTVSMQGGVKTLLTQAGEEFAAKAGGTSGVLWGAAIKSAGEIIDENATSYSAQDLVICIQRAVERIASLGKAQIGDKTMLDAMIPFATIFEFAIANGSSIHAAWTSACQAASEAAKETSNLPPKIGRARPLAEKSLGTPDPGAMSFVLIVNAIQHLLPIENSRGI